VGELRCRGPGAAGPLAGGDAGRAPEARVGDEPLRDETTQVGGRAVVPAPKSPPTVAAGVGTFGVAVSPDGGSVYVTNILGPPEPGTISQYDVGADGALVPKSPPAVADTGSFPGGLAVSADGGSVYVLNGGSDDVSQYTVSAGGALVPKIPPRVAAGLDPAGVAVTPASTQPSRPGKGCGDKNHVHERRGDCRKPPR
jgi:DNA-binding beta-propeller fold protein YncE